MTQNTPHSSNPILEALRAQVHVEQRPLRSSLPLVAGLRNLWYSIAARWGVQQVVDQQNEVNRLILTALDDHTDQTEWLRLQDAQLTDQARQIAELTARVKRLEENLKSMSNEQ